MSLSSSRATAATGWCLGYGSCRWSRWGWGSPCSSSGGCTLGIPCRSRGIALWGRPLGQGSQQVEHHVGSELILFVHPCSVKKHEVPGLHLLRIMYCFSFSFFRYLSFFFFFNAISLPRFRFDLGVGRSVSLISPSCSVYSGCLSRAVPRPLVGSHRSHLRFFFFFFFFLVGIARGVFHKG